MTDVFLRRFQPIQLKLENIGPFRSAFEMPITGFADRSAGPEQAPANFYLLASQNGFGKTTILEVIYGLMQALAPQSLQFSLNTQPLIHPDLMSGGAAQLDVKLDLESGGKASSVIVSLFAGKEIPPSIITVSRLYELGASEWIPLRLSRPQNNQSQYTLLRSGDGAHELISKILDSIAVMANFNKKYHPYGDSLLLPTALYFTADRRILQPPLGQGFLAQPSVSYHPAHRFTTDGENWASSIDGLLVWYEWLGGGLFEEAAALVNELLFAGTGKRLLEVDRHNLGAVIEVEREDGTKHRHGIGQLSHGERSLMHLLVRSAYHKTGSTILMIDEMENHLHPKWQHRLMTMLKEWVRKWPDLTVIATTHNPEMLEAFAFERKEEGLVKGGYLIEKNNL